MRRPTFCSALEEGERNSPASSSDKESRLSKMKRVITGTILLGRRSKKESRNNDESTTQYQENTQIFYENEDIELRGVENEKFKMDDVKDSFRKCKKGCTKSKSSKNFVSDEKMDTENIPTTKTKNEISISLSNDHSSGKKLKEICIEISKCETTATTEIVLKPRKRKERLDSGGSVKHENKVIRSNSEERHDENSIDVIRRVSSHEDFSKVKNQNKNESNDFNVIPKNILSDVTGAENIPASSSLIDTNLKSNSEFRVADVFLNACPEEIEHERRRSCERFARAVATPRGHRNIPRRRTKGHKTLTRSETESLSDGESVRENTKSLDVQEIKDRSPSPSPAVPSSPPALDVKSLHKQMEGSEPLTSRVMVVSPEEEAESPTVEALISPRNSLVMRVSTLDSSLPPSPPREHSLRQCEIDPREKKLQKQISSIKKKIKRYEDGFEIEFGYRPSQADKLANKDIKKMCAEINRLKTKLKQVKEESLIMKTALATTSNKPLSFLTSLEDEISVLTTNGSKSNTKCSKTMEEVLQEVEKKLDEKRQVSGRTSEIVEMNRGELLEEKLSVQKALLHLENVFGRPVTREDRDLVRPLYQRYRTLKRMVIRSSAAKLNNSTGELATILEHETMDFTASPSTSFDFGDTTTFSAPEGLNTALTDANNKTEVVDDLPKKLLEVPASDELPNSSSSSESIGENLHALPLSQLLEQQTYAREEKKKLRRSLREFEEKFQNETGRRAQKQDRLAIEGIYLNYKQVKAKLRLLDALVAKKSCYKRNSC